jgi:hypothetical protein
MNCVLQNVNFTDTTCLNILMFCKIEGIMRVYEQSGSTVMLNFNFKFSSQFLLIATDVFKNGQYEV